MQTECTPEQLEFLSLGRREIIGRFDGGRLTSDGGGLLLREVDARIGLMERVAGCFKDYRNPESIEHGVRELVHTYLWCGAGLRRSQRPRRIALRQPAGDAGWQARSDRRITCPGTRQGLPIGEFEYAQPA